MLGLCGFFMGGYPSVTGLITGPYFMLRFAATGAYLPTPEGPSSSYTFRVFSPAFDADQGNGIKTITIFICRRYNRPQSQFSNQKSIANEKHQPNADLCLAGITETF